MDQLALPLKVDVCTLGKKLHHLFSISLISDTADVRSLFQIEDTSPDILLIQQHTNTLFQITKVLNNNMIYTGILATAAISKAQALLHSTHLVITWKRK